MMITITILVCVIPSFINFDLFETPTGSLFWMCFCYLVGGYIAKYETKVKHPHLLYILCTFFMWVSRLVYDVLYTFSQEGYGGEGYVTFASYVSPFCVICSLGLLGVFCNRKNEKVRYSGLIRKISSMSSSVYLIYDNVNFKKFIWYDSFSKLSQFNSFKLFFSVIAIALGVYVLCLEVELVRSSILKKLMC